MRTVLIVSPSIEDDLQGRRGVHEARLFNLVEFLHAAGWCTTTDLNTPVGLEQIVVIGRGRELAYDVEVRLATYSAFMRRDFDWTDIDDFDPSQPETVNGLAELGDSWPPKEWRDIATKEPSRPIPLEQVGHHDTAGGAQTVHRRPTPVVVMGNQGHETSFPEGRVAAADGSFMASLDAGVLSLFDTNGAQTNRYTNWVGERGLEQETRLLAISRQFGYVIKAVVSDPHGTYSVVSADRVAWSAAERVSEPSEAGAIVGDKVLLADVDGRVVEIESQSTRVVRSSLAAVGLDAAALRKSAWLVIWGRNHVGKPVAELFRRLLGQLEWVLVQQVEDVCSAGIERPEDVWQPAASPVIWVMRSDGYIDRCEIGGV